MVKQISKRVLPGTELKAEIEKVLKENNVQAGVIVSLVGGFSEVVLRMPDGKTEKTWKENLEIVSATGTVSINGMHIHLSVSDINGNVFGGHLKSGIVRMTAEVVILKFDDVVFTREEDPITKYKELIIKENA